ncbi:MAG: hypothetical protein ACOYN0_10940 [Phycisphaerales bacterium]
MIRIALTLWRRKWNMVRLGVAVFVAVVLGADTSSRIGRLQLAALPGFDYAGEIATLRAAGRYGEAELIARAGLEDEDADHGAIDRERAATEAERTSFTRRALDAGKGALLGRGDSLESLVGAIVADFFVVGDLRDLVIQGGRYVMDGEADELVVLLSVAGVVTTVAPEIDWVPAVVKAAKKGGTVGNKLAKSLTDLIKAGKQDELATVLTDVKKLSDAGSPGAAARWLRFADEPGDLKPLAAFTSRGPSAAVALHITGEAGADLLKRAAKAGPAEVGAAERLVRAAARKGRAGAEFLKTPAARAMLRPHPLLGLLKSVWKGNAADAIARFAESIDPMGWWMVPAAAAWAVVEALLLLGGFRAARARKGETA